MLSKLTKLINKFIRTGHALISLQDHSVPFYNNNMMLCGAWRLTLYRDKHNTLVLWRFWNQNRDRGFNPKPNRNWNLQIL